jgi:hypothetical protein
MLMVVEKVSEGIYARLCGNADIKMQMHKNLKCENTRNAVNG